VTSLSDSTVDSPVSGYCSPEGLSCGDAFGERFFVHPDLAVSLIDQKSVPAPPWIFTDDTMKALSPGLTRGAEARPPPWPWKRQ
jgi:hypothetical protein